MWTPVYFVRYVDFPPRVEGVTIPNEDGTFDIYINALLSEEQQAVCLEHEVRHLSRDHFYMEKPVAVCEAEAKSSNGIPPEKKEPTEPAAPKQLPSLKTRRRSGPMVQLEVFTLEGIEEWCRRSGVE